MVLDGDIFHYVYAFANPDIIPDKYAIGLVQVFSCDPVIYHMGKFPTSNAYTSG